MLKGQDARTISGLLKMGFVADRALISLTDATAEAPVIADKEATTELIQFFDQVIESFNFEDPKPDPGLSGARAIAYFDWESVIPSKQLENDERFVEWLGQLKGTVEKIGSSQGVPQQDMESLRRFLDSVARLSLNQAYALRQKGESGSRKELWHQRPTV